MPPSTGGVKMRIKKQSDLTAEKSSNKINANRHELNAIQHFLQVQTSWSNSVWKRRTGLWKLHVVFSPTHKRAYSRHSQDFTH